MKYSFRFGLASLLGIAIALPLVVLAASTPPAVLRTPSAVCLSGEPQVTLSWSPLSGATSYSVFRNKSSAAWVNISSKQSATSFLDENVSGDSLYQYQVKTFFSKKVSFSNIVSVTVPACAAPVSPPPPAPSPAPTPTPPPPPAAPPPPSPGPTPPPPPTPTPSNQITMSAYITGYGWPDNTPPSAEISNPVIHQSAGGTGTYADPITIAVGHSIINGKDILDYAQGTKFYIPAFRRYFIVEDTCGDGSSPQNGPCHTGYQGHPWLDAWVGGQGLSSSATLACEDTITDIHTIIENPASNYNVVSGPLFSGVCTSLFGDIALTL